MGVGGVVWDLDGLDSSGFVLGRGGFGFGSRGFGGCGLGSDKLGLPFGGLDLFAWWIVLGHGRIGLRMGGGFGDWVGRIGTLAGWQRGGDCCCNPGIHLTIALTTESTYL